MATSEKKTILDEAYCLRGYISAYPIKLPTHLGNLRWLLASIPRLYLSRFSFWRKDVIVFTQRLRVIPGYGVLS